MTETKDRQDELREAVGCDPVSGSCGCAVGAQTGAGDAPSDAPDSMGPLDRILTTIEKREILGALERANGQRTLAARLLGISRSRLYRRMEALGIDPRELDPREIHPREDA